MTARARLRHWIAEHTTQQAFAAELGVTAGYLSQVLSGDRTPRLPILARIEDLTAIGIRSWLPSPHGAAAKMDENKRDSANVYREQTDGRAS